MKLLKTKRSNSLKSDNDLLNEFTSSGDLEVLGELYSRFMHLVYGVCLKYLKERDESKDAVMQIFEKLIAEIPKQKIDNFSSWLHVVTKNYCLMQLRSQKSKDIKFNEWINDPAVFMENSNVLHPIDDEEHNMKNELADCIERFLNIDEKKVKSHLQNAKRNLKICLEEKNVREQ